MFCARRVLPLCLLLLACDKKADAPASAAPPPGMPPLEAHAAAPPPADKPEHPPTTALPGQLPPGHPALPNDQIDPNAATPGDIPFDPRTVLAGVLRLDDKVKAKVKEGDAIFLVARQHDPAGGK